MRGSMQILFRKQTEIPPVYLETPNIYVLSQYCIVSIDRFYFLRFDTFVGLVNKFGVVNN